VPPSHRQKFDRAVEHLDSLKAKITTWFETNPYRVGEDDDPEPETGEYVGWMELTSEMPDGIPLDAGEIAHGFRCTLDHLAYALAVAHSGPLTPAMESHSEFPIFWTRAPTESELDGKIGGVDPRARAVIKDLQPHHAGNSYRTHYLWMLHELDRIDKHRRLNVVASGVMDFNFLASNATVEGLRTRTEMKGPLP
jgi:hypothetical protein